MVSSESQSPSKTNETPPGHGVGRDSLEEDEKSGFGVFLRVYRERLVDFLITHLFNGGTDGQSRELELFKLKSKVGLVEDQDRSGVDVIGNRDIGGKDDDRRYS